MKFNSLARIVAKSIPSSKIKKSLKKKFSNYYDLKLENIPIKEISVRGIKMRHYIPNDLLKQDAEIFEKIEPETLDWIETFEDDSVFYDLGASSGIFSIFSAIKSKSTVVSFEPYSQNFAILEMNHYINKEFLKNKIISINAALSDKTESGYMFIANNVPGDHQNILDKNLTRMDSNEFSPDHTQFILKYSLDDLLSKFSLPFPNYIKIDVDGSEELVLKGMQKTLSNNSIKSIMIEILDPDNSGNELVKFMTNFNFKLYHKEHVKPKPGDISNYDKLFNCFFRR